MKPENAGYQITTADVSVSIHRVTVKRRGGLKRLSLCGLPALRVATNQLGTGHTGRDDPSIGPKARAAFHGGTPVDPGSRALRQAWESHLRKT
jgi:hypothetical protein